MLPSLAEIPLAAPVFLIPPDCPWRVLRVKTGQEFKVERQLAARSITSYLPAFQALRNFSDRRPETISRALFPGYLFVSFERQQSTDLLSTPHVIDVLSFSGKPAQIEADEMDRIQAMSQLAGEPWQRLTVGNRVRVVSGPLRGAEGRILRHEGKLQMVIEVDILNRAVKVKIDGFALEAA